MEFLVSNKGGILACLDGHIYTKIRNGKVKIFWRCRLKSKNGCTACLTTSLERNNPELNGIHNHEPDVSTIDLIRARNRMKESAKQTNEKPVQIYSAVVATCDVTVRQRLPPQETCCHFKSLAELEEIPEEYSKTIGPNQENFLLYDNGAKNARWACFSAST